jgi:hypothetical protein
MLMSAFPIGAYSRQLVTTAAAAAACDAQGKTKRVRVYY